MTPPATITPQATKPSVVRVSGNGGDVVIIRPTGRVTILNGCDADDFEELAKKGRLVLQGDPAMEVVKTEGDVNDVLVVEGEAVIVNGQTDDDEDDDDEDLDDDDEYDDED